MQLRYVLTVLSEVAFKSDSFRSFNVLTKLTFRTWPTAKPVQHIQNGEN